MPETSARRTLMKSAPELWAQVADPEGLARRLPGVEGIRIVRTERQRHIAWEGEQASGEVILEPAGFGTKVTLTVARGASAEVAGGESGSDVVPARAAQVMTMDAPAVTPVAMATETPAAAAPSPEAQSDREPDPAQLRADGPVGPDAPTEPPTVSTPKRMGFFARLFRRAAPAAEAPAIDDAVEPALDAMPEQLTELFDALGPEEADVLAEQAYVLAEDPVREAPTPSAGAPAEADHGAVPEPPVAPVAPADVLPPAASIRAGSTTASPTPGHEGSVASPAPARAPNVDTELLEAALDSLGTNHHRPFSRG